MNLEIEKYLIPMIKLVSCYTHLDITDPDKAIHLRLDADLLIYGQDAEDLLDDYAEKFKVKDGGFQFEKYLKRGN